MMAMDEVLSASEVSRMTGVPASTLHIGRRNWSPPAELCRY